MTYEEASEYKWLVKEIALLQQQLSDLDSQYHPIAAASPKVRSAYNEIWHTLDARMKACISECERIENWIAGVQDPILQNYMYLRFVEGRTWVEIGIQLNLKPATVRQTVQRYLKKEAQRNEA